MAAQRISMRNIKELLRLKYEVKLSHRQIARSLGIAVGTVSLYINRASSAGLDWPLSSELSDSEIQAKLFPDSSAPSTSHYSDPDFLGMHNELKNKCVTKQLLWEEYKAAQGGQGLQYSQFCQRYRDWVSRQQLSMRQIHKAGEKCFVDYCGPTVEVIDARTGQIREAAIFVGVLGASNYTYSDATWSQKKADWIESHVRMFNYFGGVPARPYKPKDKSKAEVAVQIVERWILARLRHQTFFSLAELNQAIRFLLDDLNQRPFKKLPGTRLSQFNALDKPVLQPLPKTPYHYTEFKKVRVNIDYHIEFDKHYYSVPHHLVKHELEAQATYDGIALFFKGQQVARHPRSCQRGSHTTNPSHMPRSHREYQQWSPQRLLEWAENIGPDAHQLIQLQLEKRQHPEQAFRSCLAILNISKQVESRRLNRACAKAIEIGAPHVRSVKSILTNNLEELATKTSSEPKQSSFTFEEHDNIRGSQYYH